MSAAAPAHAVLVSLLRLGERSAGFAFERLARSTKIATSDPYRALLAQVAQDERRHDCELAAVAGDAIRLRMNNSSRRFFLGLHDRDIRIHLARIAALDGCVCQIVTQVLSGSLLAPQDAGLRRTLERIRHDEGRHVRIARRAAQRYGASDALLCEIDHQTRNAFCAVLAPHAEDFQALGIDPQRLLNRMRRAAP